MTVSGPTTSRNRFGLFVLKFRQVTRIVRGSTVDETRRFNPRRRHASPTVTSNDAVRITSSGRGSYHGLMRSICRFQNSFTNADTPSAIAASPARPASGAAPHLVLHRVSQHRSQMPQHLRLVSGTEHIQVEQAFAVIYRAVEIEHPHRVSFPLTLAPLPARQNCA